MLKLRILLLVIAALCALARAEEKRLAAGDFAAVGRNEFFILQPNEQWVYEGIEKSVKTRLTVTVLDETGTFGGIEARVVEAKRAAGKTATTQRSHFAIDNKTNDVYRFDANSEIAMPAKPRVGQKFGQQKIISLTEAVRVPAGSFSNCLKITDGSVDTLYARGVGAVQIGQLKLIRHGPKKIGQAKQATTQLDAEPIVPVKLAREAMGYVGADPDAEEVWVQAINDPALSPHERSDLIEDLNESGFSDGNGKHATVEDLPIVMNRLALIEQLAPDAIDQVNYDAFAEAYKDLVNIAKKLTEQ